MGVLRANVGGTWVDVPMGPLPTSSGRGLVGRANAPTTPDQTISPSAFTDLTGLSVTFTADPTRVYKSMAGVYFVQNTAAGFCQLSLTDGTNAAKRRAAGNFGAAIAATLVIVHHESGLSGSQTIKARFSTTAGTTTIGNANQLNGYLIVEDIGAA